MAHPTCDLPPSAALLQSVPDALHTPKSSGVTAHSQADPSALRSGYWFPGHSLGLIVYVILSSRCVLSVSSLYEGVNSNVISSLIR